METSKYNQTLKCLTVAIKKCHLPLSPIDCDAVLHMNHWFLLELLVDMDEMNEKRRRNIDQQSCYFDRTRSAQSNQQRSDHHHHPLILDVAYMIQPTS